MDVLVSLAFCFHLVNAISLSQSQSDHIKNLNCGKNKYFYCDGNRNGITLGPRKLNDNNKQLPTHTKLVQQNLLNVITINFITGLM
jgi:hypothetical protein